jgi:hypothetical protein
VRFSYQASTESGSPFAQALAGGLEPLKTRLSKLNRGTRFLWIEFPDGLNAEP